MQAIRPFPFGSLARWSRVDVANARALARRLGPPATHPDLLGAWKTLRGVWSARSTPPLTLTSAAVLGRLDGAVTCAICTHPTLGTIVAACDRSFADELACEALSIAPDARPGFVAGPAWEGSLVALASRVISRAWTSALPPIVRAVTDDLGAAIEAIAPRERLLFWPWTLSRDGAAATAVLLADAEIVTRVPVLEADAPWPSRALDVPVPWSLSAAAVWWSAAAVASLTAGEVLALDALAHRDGALAGDVTLRVASPAALVSAATITDRRSVTLTSALTAPELPMNEPDESSGRLASIPIELSVEIARGSARVGDLAAWRPGEVITLDTPLGEAVLVRANGRAVCRGELVDIDGSVGVRITELL